MDFTVLEIFITVKGIVVVQVGDAGVQVEGSGDYSLYGL